VEGGIGPGEERPHLVFAIRDAAASQVVTSMLGSFSLITLSLEGPSKPTRRLASPARRNGDSTPDGRSLPAVRSRGSVHVLGLVQVANRLAHAEVTSNRGAHGK